MTCSIPSGGGGTAGVALLPEVETRILEPLLSIQPCPGGSFTFTNPEAETFVAAMAVEPDDTRKALIDNTVGDLKAAGVFARIGILTLLAAHDAQASRINVKTATNYWGVVGSPVFTPDRGWTQGVGGRLSGGELYTGTGGLFTYSVGQHHAGWIENDATSLGFVYNQIDQFQYWLQPRDTSGNAQAEAGDQQSSQIAVADSLGWYLANHGGGAGTQGFFKNNSLLTSSFVGNQFGQSNRSVQALGNAPIQPSNHRLAAFSAGAKLTDAQRASFYSIMLAYMQAVGAA